MTACEYNQLLRFTSALDNPLIQDHRRCYTQNIDSLEHAAWLLVQPWPRGNIRFVHGAEWVGRKTPEKETNPGFMYSFPYSCINTWYIYPQSSQTWRFRFFLCQWCVSLHHGSWENLGHHPSQAVGKFPWIRDHRFPTCPALIG